MGLEAVVSHELRAEDLTTLKIVSNDKGKRIPEIYKNVPQFCFLQLLLTVPTISSNYCFGLFAGALPSVLGGLFRAAEGIRDYTERGKEEGAAIG